MGNDELPSQRKSRGMGPQAPAVRVSDSDFELLGPENPAAPGLPRAPSLSACSHGHLSLRPRQVASAPSPSFATRQASHPELRVPPPNSLHHFPLITPRGSRQAPTMTSTIGIPIKLLNEAQGHIITLELDSGTTYRGKLIEGTQAPTLSPSPSLPLPTPRSLSSPPQPC